MEAYLPTIFIGLMALAVLVYAVLDGYDLGVGMLLPMQDDRSQRDTMIASIGPFWDANETWLVLAVGLMLIAFPAAHSLVFNYLYLPAFFMLIGLIIRGVAFDFRAKAATEMHQLWDYGFKFGSALVALSQGYMLGRYVTGFEDSTVAYGFSVLSAVGVAAAYCYIGACWLILKTEARLQQRALTWAKCSGRACALGIVEVCIVNLSINPTVYERWMSAPFAIFIMILPALCTIAFIVNDRLLSTPLPFDDRICGLPFLLAAMIFLLSFLGLAFSFYPDIVPGHMTIYEAASAPESLAFILVGAIFVIPVILGYTVFAYRVFHGKASDLQYH